LIKFIRLFDELNAILEKNKKNKNTDTNFFGLDDATMKAMSILDLEIYENYNEYMQVAKESFPTLKEDQLGEIRENYNRSYFLFKVKNFIENKREDIFSKVTTIPIKINLKTGLSDYYNYKSKISEDAQKNDAFEYIEKLIKINDDVKAHIQKKEYILVNNLLYIII
jgi:hypothetical protein